MIRFLGILIALFAFTPDQARASYWLECLVHTKVKRNLDTGLYRAEIKGAKVSGGHQEKGSTCLKDMIGKTVKIKIKGNPPEGKTIRLKYELHNGFAPEGGEVNIIKWSYYPPSIRDILPW